MNQLRADFEDFGPRNVWVWSSVGSRMRKPNSGVLVRAFVLGLPMWWVLGLDWLILPLLAAGLFLSSPSTYTRFRESDYLMLAAMLFLGLSAFVNGLVISGEPTRFLAANYNLTVLISSFVVMLAVRRQLQIDPEALSLLKACSISFLGLVVVVWSCVAIAFASRQFALEVPSIFGWLFGSFVPDSAPLIRDSTRLTFSQADWGLPNIPTPRIAVYGPYPTATAATVAVLGSMTLLYLYRMGRGQWRAIAIPILEVLIIVTIATTLTRSILGGWLIGAITANLIFGTTLRRILATGLLLGGLVAAPNIHSATQALEYRSYSSESRFENYVYAADQTFRQSAVFGLGIKPREEGNHIAVGSHSTFVSFFTKGGIVVLSLGVVYFLLMPALRWIGVITGAASPSARPKAELRILLNLQIAIWIWLFFEDIDAPASAAALIFLSLAFIEQGLLSRLAVVPRWLSLPNSPQPRQMVARP